VHSKIIRLVGLTVGLAFCLLGIWTSGKAGYSRLLSNQLRRGQVSIEAGSQAIKLTPNDPEAYYAHGRALLNSRKFAEAARDFEAALVIQPNDYLLWLQLGYARNRQGDLQGAQAAYQEGVRLAPFYGQPRWYLGRLLLRAGRSEEAFVQLRRAVNSDPKLFNSTVELAWTELKGDGEALWRALRPESSAARFELASFLVQQGNVETAMRIFRETEIGAEEDSRRLLNNLLRAKKFPEAYEVWAASHHTGKSNTVLNGSFESDIRLNDPGFGWQLERELRAVQISLDTQQSRDGSSSLRIDWSGNSNPAQPVISQLVLVAPNTRYRLTFAARARELLTIGPPVVTVTDAGDTEAPPLGQSQSLAQGTTGWQDYSVEFVTSEKTAAVQIQVQREKCALEPCAILGHSWLDNFLLTAIAQGLTNLPSANLNEGNITVN